MKKRFLYGILFVGIVAICSGCGNSQKDTAEKTTTTTEAATTEEVTEFKKEKVTYTFGEIENGINFKASSSQVTFSFENMKKFDNSLKMEFSLSDGISEQNLQTIAVNDQKKDYTFKGLKKGKKYYLEVYPLESAGSDQKYKEIETKNKNVVLELKQK